MRGLEEWKETKNIAFVDVEYFRGKAQKLEEKTFSLSLKDVHGQKISVSRRAAVAMNKFLNKGKALELDVSLKEADVPGIKFYQN